MMLPENLMAEMNKRKALESLVLDSLPSSLKQAFNRCAIIGDTLTIYLKHQAFKKEFESKKPQILGEMRGLYKERNLRTLFVFKAIRAQVLHLPLKKGASKRSEERFRERGNGDFVNGCKDSNLYLLFEEIRIQIKERKEEEEAEETGHE